MGLLKWLRPKQKPKKAKPKKRIKKPGRPVHVVEPASARKILDSLKDVQKPMPSLEAAEAVKRIAEVITKKKPPCPEKHKLMQVCACINCPQLGSCHVEKACRSTGCDSVISICSRKTVLEKGEGAESDFGDHQAHMSTHRVIKELMAEEGKPKKIVVEKNKEETNGKEKTEGTPGGEGPTVLG